MLAFLTTASIMAMNEANANGVAPGYKSVLANPNLQAVSPPAKVWSASLEHAWCAPRIPGMFEMEQALGNEINRALVGQISAKEALDNGNAAWRVDHGEERLLLRQRALHLRRLRPGGLRGRRQAAAVLMAERDRNPAAAGRRKPPPGRCSARCAGAARRMRKAMPYLLVAPAVLYLLTITLYPGAFALWQSFYVVRFNQMIPAGIANYQMLLGDREFWAALGNTVIIGGIALALETVIAHGAGLLRLSRPLHPRLAHRVPDADALHALGGRLHLEARLQRRPGHLGPPDAARPDRRATSTGSASVWLARTTLIVADVWQWTPFLFIIFVAGLQSQDQEIEEAARLDGASWPAIFWNISLPMMRPVIAVAVVLRGIDITTMFTNVYIMTQGTPGRRHRDDELFHLPAWASGPSTSAMPRPRRWSC